MLDRTLDEALSDLRRSFGMLLLRTATLMAFVATADAARARALYEDTLGLRLVADQSFAIVFDANGTQLRIQKVKQTQPPPFTVLGWQVPDIKETVSALTARGIVFEGFNFMQQDDLGIWPADETTKVA